jgi:hypothetical protein
VDKNSNMENGVGVQMDEFNLVVLKEPAEEVAGNKLADFTFIHDGGLEKM